MFITEQIVIAMPPAVEDNERLAALRVTGRHQSGGLVTIYNLSLIHI